jgi:uncharacterized protein YjbJ (UPF0337 family)
MDKDVVKGKVKQAEGRLQEAKGALTGSGKDKANVKQAEGKVQEGVGKVKDAARKAIDKS